MSGPTSKLYCHRAKVAVLVSAALVLGLAAGAYVFREAIFAGILDRQFRTETSLLTDGHMHVILLGTGSPQADHARAKAGVAIFARGRMFLFDAGPGVVASAENAKLPLSSLGAVFFTHYHSDHIGDFGQLLTESWLVGRKTPLGVYGPQGLLEVVGGFARAFAPDAQYRSSHLGEELMPKSAAVPIPHEFGIGPDEQRPVLDKDGVKVIAFSVDHEPVLPAVGYRIEYGGHVVVLSGDTRKSDKVVQAARGADLLIHEALFGTQMVGELDRYYARRGQEQQRVRLRLLRAYHSTPVEAAEVASRAGAKKLVLTHVAPLPNLFARSMYLRGAADAFAGPITIGEDGMRFDL
ncbi:MAG TPA: MBL fold metallo-hydrolase [Anaeromyxobacteraceae bacterium]|nr:MBL fold metallo-hydrolase [Anaeromyxobacteraceae bacterium]